jgi:hypothetical protein
MSLPAPDGTKLVSGGADRNVQNQEFNGYRKVIKAAAFNKTGAGLASSQLVTSPLSDRSA